MLRIEIVEQKEVNFLIYVFKFISYKLEKHNNKMIKMKQMMMLMNSKIN